MSDDIHLHGQEVRVAVVVRKCVVTGWCIRTTSAQCGLHHDTDNDCQHVLHAKCFCIAYSYAVMGPESRQPSPSIGRDRAGTRTISVA